MKVNEKMGKIFVLMGKSATGKDTIYKELFKINSHLNTIVTYTTRPMRENEIEGREYHFVTKDELDNLKKENKVIEHRVYNTVYGEWNYFTVDDAQINIDKKNYLIIGTLESFIQIRKYFGSDKVIPIYVYVDDGIRLQRALNREKEQTKPKYEEMCRRFLADAKDFEEAKLKESGILDEYRFENTNLDQCVNNIDKYINKLS